MKAAAPCTLGVAAAVFATLPDSTAAVAAPADDFIAAVEAASGPGPDWTPLEPPRLVAGDELFDLIDGGAELYHEYGFKRAASVRLQGASGGTLQTEIYEMADTAAAFGVFSLMQTDDAASVALGQGGLLFDYYAVFWEGPFFVSVTGSRSGEAERADVLRVARQIDGAIGPTAALPDWFGALPPGGLERRWYFRGGIALANIDRSGIGGLAGRGEGLGGSYGAGGVRLFLFRCESAEDATARLAAAREKAPDPSSTDDGARLWFAASGDMLAVFAYRNEEAFRKTRDAFLGTRGLPGEPR